MASVTNTGLTSLTEDGITAIIYQLTASHTKKLKFVVRMRDGAKLIGEFETYDDAMIAAVAACRATSEVTQPN